MAATPGVNFAGKPTQVETGTHNGARNKPNEDRYDAFVGPGGNGQQAQFLVVADGVTSTHGGERASDIAVRVLRRLLQSPATSNRPLKPLRTRMAEAINGANAEILETARRDPDLKGMSTTLVLAAVDGDQLTIMHLGDSRAYLIRNGKAYQLTRDHTWVQEAMDEGRITAEQARTHPNKHVIQRYLGDARGISIDHGILDPARPLANPDQTEMVGPTVRSGEETMTLRPGDALLLCSDGLYNRITDEEIAAAATKYAPEKAVRSLIEQAVKRDEPDNITIVFWPTGDAPVAAAAVAPRRPVVALGLASAGVLLALAAVWFIMNQSGGQQAGPPPGGEAVAAVVAASPTAEGADAVQTPPEATPTPEPAPDTPTAKATVPATATAVPTDTPTAQPTATPLAQFPNAESPDGALTVTATMTINSALDEFSAATQAIAVSNNPTNTASSNTDDASTPTPTTTAVTTVTRAPTATPLTTATPTPTLTPTATSTRQPTPTRGQQTPPPTITSLAAIPSPPASQGPTSARILSPPDNTASGQPVQFAWEPDRQLALGQEYEVIFWRTNEDESAGRGWVRSSTATSVAIDPERSPSADTYRWAVYLVGTEPYTRLRRISEVRTFTASVGGSGSGSGGGGGGGGEERP